MPQTEKHGEGWGMECVLVFWPCLLHVLLPRAVSYLRLWAPNLPTLTDTFSASFFLSLSLFACHLSRALRVRGLRAPRSRRHFRPHFWFLFQPQSRLCFFSGAAEALHLTTSLLVTVCVCVCVCAFACIKLDFIAFTRTLNGVRVCAKRSS